MNIVNTQYKSDVTIEKHSLKMSKETKIYEETNLLLPTIFQAIKVTIWIIFSKFS